jgi:undecaprenyl diphosphate synthase
MAGHRRGVRAVFSTVETAPSLGIHTLTLYAFSSDNWNRPETEVSALMKLLRDYLRRETPRCVREGIRIRMIGRRDRLQEALVNRVEAAEAATAGGTKLDLRIAVDYSARDIILRAASAAGDRLPSRDRFARLIAAASGAGEKSPDVDLLIRTGGEQRLSDFLLWECAYSEFVFTPVLWPDFKPANLEAAVREFRSRQRRFGRVPPSSGRRRVV